MGNSDTHAHIP